MENLKSLVQLVGGHLLPAEDDGPSRRTQIIALSVLVSACLCAAFGAAAGGTELAASLANLIRVPLIVLLSSFSALPAGLLAWKLVGARSRASDLVLATAAGTLTGSLILAVLAPIVALYYHSSLWFGAVLAAATALLAFCVGIGVLVRTVALREGGGRVRRYVPALVMIAVQVLTLPQLISVVGGVLPEVTVFDGGIDTLLGR